MEYIALKAIKGSMESIILDNTYILFGLSLMLHNNICVFSEVPQLPPFPVVTSQGYIYHVNNTPGIGKDTAAGGTAENPWLTLKYAINRIDAGDSLFVHGTEFPYLNIIPA